MGSWGWGGILLVIVLVVVVGGMATGFVWMWRTQTRLQAWRPPLQPGERYGVDVTPFPRTAIDWARVARGNISFAYIKASEGGDTATPRFAETWKAVEQSGLQPGAYHTFELCTPGAVQAGNFLRAAPPSPGALAPAVHLSLFGECSGRRPTQAAASAELDGFLRLVEEAWGGESLIYVVPGSEYSGRRLTLQNPPDRPAWIQSRGGFTIRPAQDEWRVWQVHSWAKVDGAAGTPSGLNVLRPER